jgi:hypothetical protein
MMGGLPVIDLLVLGGSGCTRHTRPGGARALVRNPDAVPAPASKLVQGTPANVEFGAWTRKAPLVWNDRGRPRLNL